LQCFFKLFFLHCFLHFFNFFSLISQFFILHFVLSARPSHLSTDGDEGGVGGSEGGGADGGSASHRLQVFLHCCFSSSEYFFLHLVFLQVKSFAL